MIRVAFLNRPRTYPGGDLIALDATMAALGHLGVDCCECQAWSETADLTHVFHINFPWSRDNFLSIPSGKPYAVTPVFYPEDQGASKTEMANYLRGAAAILPFSGLEGGEMCRYLGISVPYTPVPNGTDPAFHFPSDGAAREGVCAVGARQGDGKPWEIIGQACSALGVPFSFITGVPHEALPALYRRHKVFVSASRSERMSLVIGEALCAGCRVLATMANRGNGWYGPGLARVDPEGTVEYFTSAIRTAYLSPEWDWRPNEAARRLTWSAVAVVLKGIYERVK